MLKAYYLVEGSIKVRLGDVVHDVSPGSLVFIPAGLPHCNWNPGPDSETHLEMIIPATDRLKQIAYMIDKPGDVPPEWRTNRKGYVRRVESRWLKEPLPGFKTVSLADPSSGCDTAVILYAEVGPQNGGPDTHIHEFDQYYFVLEGELTIEVALQSTSSPETSWWCSQRASHTDSTTRAKSLRSTSLSTLQHPSLVVSGTLG